MHELVKLIVDAQAGDPISPAAFASVLELDLRELEKCAGVEKDTATLNPESETLQRYLRASLLVIMAIARETFDPNTAVFRFKYLPLGEFSHKTPQTLVSEGRAVDFLLRF